MGARKTAIGRVRAEGPLFAALEPDAMRAYLLSHPLSNGGRTWCDRVVEGVAAGRRGELRLFSEAMRWTSATTNIAIVMGEKLRELGARDETEARELIGSGKKLVELRAQGVSARESYETAKDLMRLSFMEESSLRDEAIAWITGSHAVVVDTDVSTNGGAH